MRLLVYDPAWPLYVPLLRQALDPGWEIRAAANDPAWLLRELPSAEALIALRLPAEARGAALPRLKVLCFQGAGSMHEHASELPAGCRLCNVYEHEIPIAEYVMANVLLHVTLLRQYAESFRTGRWDGNGRIGGKTHGEAHGKTLGLIGYGQIGQAIAARARSFGMPVQAICRDPRRYAGVTPVPDFLGGPGALGDVLERSDFLVIACPLTSATRGLLGAPELARLRRNAFLINVSRAEIVDEDALYQVLRGGRIAGAALDVWYRYPSSSGKILHGSRLPFHELPNVLVTPHLAAWTHALLDRRMARIAENLNRLALGKELERVVLVGTWRPGAESVAGDLAG